MDIKQKFGFTLVELFITTAIIFLVATAVYTTFSNGVTVWRRCNVDTKWEKRTRLTLTKVVRDIRNTFDFSEIPFEGTQDSVFFPGLIDNEVGRIVYFFDETKKAFCKEEKTFPYVYKEKEIQEYFVTALLPDVEKMELSYCYLDNATGGYKWKDDWKKEEQDTIPQAIEMELVCKKDKEEFSYKRTIFIPIGTGEQRIEIE